MLRHAMKNFFRRFPLYFDRSFSQGLWRQVKWLLMIMLAVYIVLVVFSFTDLFYQPGAQDSRGRWYDILFLLLDPGSISGSFLAPFAIVVALFGMIVFSGMLISVISNLLERRVEQYKAGETNYNESDHVIVLGFNKSVPSLLKTVHAKYPESYIMLMCDCDCEAVRDSIHANVDKAIEDKLIVLNGDLNAEDDLCRLNLDKGPKKIYVLGDDNTEEHDAVCLVCVKQISKILRRLKVDRKCECMVQINSQDMYSLLQQADFCRSEGIDNLKFFPFNFNEIWAHKALSIASFGEDGYIPLDGKGIGADSDKRVHLVIAGMNGMARALALNAAHILHFPNFKAGDENTYSRITFISPDAKERGEKFRNRMGALFHLARWREGFGQWTDPLGDNDSDSPYKYLGPENFLDIEWEFIEGSLSDPEIRDYLDNIPCDRQNIATLAICGEDSKDNLGYCIGLSQQVLNGFSMILVQQKESDIAVRLLQHIPGRHDNVRAFGMMTECYFQNLLSDDFGKLVNALYNNGGIGDIDLEKDMDKIDAWWEQASITDRWSSNYSANMLFVKLRALGFNDREMSDEEVKKALDDPKNQDLVQQMEHNRWVTEKLLLGFKPLTLDEQLRFRQFNGDPAKIKELRKKMAKESKKHLDICSNSTLRDVDPAMAVYDNFVNEELFHFLKKFYSLKRDNI